MSRVAMKAVEPVDVKVKMEKPTNMLARMREIYDEIANHAFARFERRDHVNGYDVDDWLEAERPLLMPISIELLELEDGNYQALAMIEGFDIKDLKISVEPTRLLIS